MRNDAFESFEDRLKEALFRLVYHDKAAAEREGLEGCLELQQAIELLSEIDAYWLGQGIEP